MPFLAGLTDMQLKLVETDSQESQLDMAKPVCVLAVHESQVKSGAHKVRRRAQAVLAIKKANWVVTAPCEVQSHNIG